MNHSPYLLFHQSPEQLRRIGARGGKAQARNRRDRLSGEPRRPPQTAAPLLPAPQSTAAAIRGSGCAVPVAARSREARHSLLSTMLIPPRRNEAVRAVLRKVNRATVVQLLSKPQWTLAAALGLSRAHLYSHLGGAHRYSLRPRPARMYQA
jgi:hypothetical protein